MLKKTDNIISIDLNKIKGCNVNCINIILLFLIFSLFIPAFLFTIYGLFNIIYLICFGFYFMFTKLNLFQIFLCCILYINSFIILLYYINVNYNKEFSKYKKYRNRIKSYGRKLFKSKYSYREDNPCHILNDNILIIMRIIFILSFPFFISFSYSDDYTYFIISLYFAYSIAHGVFRSRYEINRCINYKINI